MAPRSLTTATDALHTVLARSRPRNASFDAWALASLREAGIPHPKVGVDAKIHLPPTEPNARIITRRVQDVTPQHIERLNNEPGPLARLENAQGVLSLGLPCFQSIPCSITPWCCTKKITWALPGINFQTHPDRIQWAKIWWNPLNFHLNGNVVSALLNESSEGTKTTQIACRCSGGKPSTKTDKVPGSADITSDGLYSTVIAEVNKVLMEQQLRMQAKSGEKVEVNADFDNRGWDAIKSIWTILTSGVARVNVKITTTVTYPWQGKTNQKKYDMHVQGVLPVQNLYSGW